MYGKPEPVPFTRALFCWEWLHHFRHPRVETVLICPPPHFGPLFWFLSKDPYMESPNAYLSPQPCFAKNGCITFEIQGSKVCSTIRPLTLGQRFGFFQGTHVWKAPTNTFHQSLPFARNGCISFKIQGSKVSSTIRPLTLSHCFGFFQGTHVWKAPTSTFHQSLVLLGMVASFSRSKGRKCA